MAYTQQTPIGTPDVNLITKTLAGLQPDSALQQYAQLHKNNPYILSLAKSESDRRKALRMAVQGNPGQQPTVVDQSIAGMAPASAGTGVPLQTGYGGRVQTGSGGRVQTELPEDQGIAQIPTPNIQRMADGGIAGYEDDEEGMATGGMGGMFNFAQQSEPVVRMSGGGHIPRYKEQGLVRLPNESFAEFRRRVFDAELQAERDRNAKEKKLKETERLQLLASRGEGKMVPPSPFFDRAPLAISGETSAANPEVTSADSTGMGMGMPTGVGLPAGTDVSALKQPAYVPAGTQPPPPPAPTTQQGLGSLPSAGKVISPEDAVKQAEKFVDYGPAEMEIAYARDRQTKQGEDLLRTFEESKPQTKAFEGLEKLLDKQEAETGGEKDKAAGLALIMAGLGIAGGSSPNALQNLKEAIPAVKEYGEALKDIKKMGRENMKMRADIEQARRAEDKDDTKTLLLLKERIAAREDKIDELGIGLLMKVADTNARTAGDIWKTSYEGVNRKETAGIAAAAGANAELNKYARIGAADPNSALARGFQMYKQEGAEPRLYGEYIKLSRDPIDGAAFREKYPTFDVFKSGYSGSAMQFAAPPANAPILKPPKG